MKTKIVRLLIIPIVVICAVCLTATTCMEGFSFDGNKARNNIYAICDLDAYDGQITPGRSHYIYCNHSYDLYMFEWDRGFRSNIPNDTIDFYILSAERELLDKRPFNTSIPLTQSDIDKILSSDIIARYRLSPEDRHNLINRVYFPPSYEMRKMKMTPSYEYLTATYGK